MSPSQFELGRSIAFAMLLHFSFTTLQMVFWKSYNWFAWQSVLFSLLAGSAIAYLI